MAIRKNKAGTALFFTHDEKFRCAQCPAEFPTRGTPKGSSITLVCAADWCPLFAYYLEDAIEVD